MKIFSRVATVLLVFFLCRAFMACCTCSAPLTIYNFQAVEIFNLDNRGEKGIISNAAVLSKDAYGIRLQFDVTRISNVANTLFTEALAGSTCRDCGDFTMSIRNTLRDLNVTTLSDFDDQHPAGSNVTALFKILDGDLYVEVDEYTERRKSPLFDQGHIRPVIELYLLTPPTSPDEQSFKLDMTFYSDTLRLSATSHPVMLQ